MWRFFLLLLFISIPALAQSTAEQVVPGTYSGNSWTPLSSSNPMPIAVYDAGNHTGYCYTSNGSGSPATFQSCGGGSGVTSFSAGTTGLTPSSATNGAITLAGTLGIANGGTGSSSLGCTISNNKGVLSTSQCSDDFVYTNTTYAIPASDAGRVVNYQGTGNITMTIASASSTGFTQGFAFAINNPTAYTVTFAPTGSYCGNILNTTSTCTIPPYTGCMYRSDNTNYPANLESCSAMTTIQIPGSTGNVLYNSGGILAASTALTVGSSSLSFNVPISIGTAAFSDTGVLAQLTGSANGYEQVILQNTNTGSSASADYIVGGNDMTASTHYGDLGSNGSAGGTAPFTNADARYVYTSDNEFDIGALGASGAINLAVGATPTTELSIGTSSIVASELISAPHFAATDTTANTLPVGTTGQRPSGIEGMIRDNTTLHTVETYLNGGWQQVVSATNGLVNLASQVTGTLGVANGGTGSSTGNLSASFTGTTNPVVWDSSTQIATDKFVQYAVQAAMATTPLNIAGSYTQISFIPSCTSYPVINETSTGGVITGTTVYAGGAGCTVGDVINFPNGNQDAYLIISAVNGSGGATALGILYGGSGYPASVSGITLVVPNTTPYQFNLSGAITSNVNIISAYYASAANGGYFTASNQWMFSTSTTGNYTASICQSTGSDSCGAGTSVVLTQGMNTTAACDGVLNCVLQDAVYQGVTSPFAPSNYPGILAGWSGAATSGSYTQVLAQDTTASGQAGFYAMANDGTNLSHYAGFFMNNSASPSITNVFWTDPHAAGFYSTDGEVNFGSGVVTGTSGAAINFYVGQNTTPNLTLVPVGSISPHPLAVSNGGSNFTSIADTGRSPTSSDDTGRVFSVGQFWKDQNNALWTNIVNTTSAAVWNFIGKTNPYPCDAAGGCYTAYGPIQLVSSYTGPAFDVYNGSATKTIAFINGVADWTTADTFCQGLTCNYTNIYNQTSVGHTHDCIPASSANYPSYNYSSVNGVRTISFDGNNRAQKWLTGASCNDANASLNDQAMSIFFIGREDNVGASATQLQLGGTSAYSFWWFASSAGHNMFSTGGNCFPSGSPGTISTSPTLWGFVTGASAIQIYNDDILQSPCNGQFTLATWTNMTIGVNPASSGGNTPGAFDLIGFMSFNSGLSTTQVSNLKKSVYSENPIYPQLRQAMVFIGDSLTQGWGDSIGATWPNQLSQMVTRNYKLYDIGVAGVTCNGISTASSNFTQQALQQANPFSVSDWCGSNDIFSSTTPAATYGYLQTTIANIRSTNATVPILVLTMIDRANGAQETNRQAYNTLIKNGIAAGTIGTGPIYLVDVGGSAPLGVSGNSINTTYFQTDQIHLTSAGYNVVASNYKAVMDANNLWR